MGWSISIKETKKGSKYKIWSSTIDKYLTDKWLTREEVVNYLFWHRFNQFAEDFIKDAMTFPDQWFSKDDSKRIDTDIMDKFYDFRLKACHDPDLLFNKFIEELNKHNIKLSVKDDKYTIEN